MRTDGEVTALSRQPVGSERDCGRPSRLRALVATCLVVAIACAVVACAPTQDGADLVRSFFRHLESHRFDAAADLVREADGAPLFASTRDRFVRGWRNAYEGYDIRFTNVVVQCHPNLPGRGIPVEDIRRAGAVEGCVCAVKFEGSSNSPCVPVNSDVIPGTTQPIALKRADGSWFLLAGGVEGFVHTCPAP
jgi:hypothetical protein